MRPLLKRYSPLLVKTYGSKIRAVANNPKKKREEDESAHFIDWQTILREAKDIFES